MTVVLSDIIRGLAPPLVTEDERKLFPFMTFAQKNVQEQTAGKLKKRKVTAQELMMYSKVLRRPLIVIDC